MPSASFNEKKQRSVMDTEAEAETGDYVFQRLRYCWGDIPVSWRKKL